MRTVLDDENSHDMKNWSDEKNRNDDGVGMRLTRIYHRAE
jgi:hypothetical protein